MGRSPLRVQRPLRGAFHTYGMPHRCASVFSHPLEWLFRRHGQVGYALLTRSPVYSEAEAPFPPDLHVLGTPPAFVLSQDQTLHRKKTLAFLPFCFLPLPQLPPPTTAPRNGKDHYPTVRSDKKHSFNEQILLFIVFPPVQCRENSGKAYKATTFMILLLKCRMLLSLPAEKCSECSGRKREETAGSDEEIAT